MRSGEGSFWPRSLCLDLLEDFLPCDALRAAALAGFLAAGLLACAESENTPNPAARSSEEAKCVAFLSLMRIVPDRVLNYC
jgi:hypothetical protein